MRFNKKIIVAETEIGVLYKNQQFIKFLPAGVHRVWDCLNEYRTEIFDISKTLQTAVSDNLLYLASMHGEAFAKVMTLWETSDQEVGVIYEKAVVKDIKAPAQRGAYWKNGQDIRVEKLDISENIAVPKKLAELLATHKDMALRKAVIDATINETQIGLLFKEQQFIQFLFTGVHSIWNWRGEYQIQVFNMSDTLQTTMNKDVLHLTTLHPDAFAEVMTVWETGEREVGLVYEKNVLKDIKAPSKRGAYWKNGQDIRVEKLDISENFTVSKKLAALLANAKNDHLRQAVLEAIVLATVPENHTGFLVVDGETIATLATGTHVWWRFNRTINVTLFDGRLQNMEVNGQEILTKDRVSLRINLSATWQIKQPEVVKAELADAKDFLYRELQLALRTVVSTQTLDDLLADKNSLNNDVLAIVAEKARSYGIEVKTIGARDIVLPGEMKTILTQVVEAQKLAEANLIKRQEETQATRSLHNTAKVMEGNPVLLRLKELEILEKITGRINTLNVYGGLDGVMNDMVRLTERTKS